MIDLLAFGCLEVRDAAAGPLPRVLAQPKRAALLAYLALARPRGLHRRDELLTVFWPESETKSARNALSRALSYLRRELPEEVIVTRGVEEVGVDLERVRSDVVEFEDAVARGDHGQAVRLHRGPFLHALHVADAPGFERWVDEERERLREQASRSAWALAHAHIAAGRHVDAERTGQQALAWCPTDESAVRDFIAALAPGDRAAALRFYEKFAAMLADELDVAPAPETAATAAAVRARDGEAATPDAVTGAAGRSGAAFGGSRQAPAPAPSMPKPPVAIEGDVPVAVPDSPGRWRRAAPWGAGIAIVASLAGGVWWSASDGTGRPGTLIDEGRTSRHASVLVADLTAPFDPMLGVTAAEWLRAELGQSDIVRPVGTAALGAALRRMGRDPSLPVDAATAREIAVRDGYALVVTGSIADLGAQYLLTISLESSDGEVLGRFHASAGSDADFPAALDSLGGEIRARIGESRRAIGRSPPLEQVTTGSLEALRLYTQAVALMDREGRHADAIPLLERAIELDDGFAMAYRKLQVALFDLQVHPDSQAELRRLAYLHRDRLTAFERLAVEAAYAVNDTSDRANECQIAAESYRLYEAYVRAHPEDPRPLAMYGFYASRMGRESLAIETYRRVIEMGAGTNVTYNNLVYASIRAGDLEGARAALRAWKERMPESVTIEGARGDLLYASGEYAAADSVFGERAAHGGAGAALKEAEIDLLRGRVTEATTHYRESVRLVDRSGEPPSGPLAARLSVLHLALAGDTAGVEARWTRDTPDPVSYGQAVWYEVGLYFAARGDPDRARQALDTLTALGAGEYWLVHGLLRAAVGAAAGDPGSVEALDVADSGCRLSGWDYRFFPLMRGRALEAMGRPGQAIEAYEAWLAGTPLLRWDAIFMFDTLDRLGRLHESVGRSAEAAEHYARAAELWKDADPELQPRVHRLR